VHVRAQGSRSRRDVVVREDHDVVDGAHGRDQQRASPFRQHRTSLALQAAHGPVAVHADHEDVRLRPRPSR
jgi:hypothetical protein